MSEPLKLVVAGAGGRMGQMLCTVVAAHPGCALHGAFDRAGNDAIGTHVLGTTIIEDASAALAGADGLLDFTSPDASLELAKITADTGQVHIIGTTGFRADQEAQLKSATRGARVVKAGNFSLGVNLLTALTKQVATRLGTEFDIEISETHHRHKVDAPSGTALMLGEAAASGRGVDLTKASERGRDGITGARGQGAIGFSSIRAGEVIGEHTVIFGGASERLELTHKANDRALFADGAVTAALWARDQGPGFYDMSDVLGL